MNYLWFFRHKRNFNPMLCALNDHDIKNKKKKKSNNNNSNNNNNIWEQIFYGYARSVMVIAVRNGHGISSWTPLNPHHSNPNPKPLANQLWCIGFLTPPLPLIIPHRLPAFLESLMQLKNWCSIYARWSKTFWSIPNVSVAFFPSLKLHIVLLKCPHVQIAFLKFTSYDNQTLVGCVPIAAVAVHLNL